MIAGGECVAGGRQSPWTTKPAQQYGDDQRGSLRHLDAARVAAPPKPGTVPRRRCSTAANRRIRRRFADVADLPQAGNHAARLAGAHEAAASGRPALRRSDLLAECGLARAEHDEVGGEAAGCRWCSGGEIRRRWRTTRRGRPGRAPGRHSSGRVVLIRPCAAEVDDPVVASGRPLVARARAWRRSRSPAASVDDGTWDATASASASGERRAARARRARRRGGSGSERARGEQPRRRRLDSRRPVPVVCGRGRRADRQPRTRGRRDGHCVARAAGRWAPVCRRSASVVRRGQRRHDLRAPAMSERRPSPKPLPEAAAANGTQPSAPPCDRQPHAAPLRHSPGELAGDGRQDEVGADVRPACPPAPTSARADAGLSSGRPPRPGTRLSATSGGGGLGAGGRVDRRPSPGSGVALEAPVLVTANGQPVFARRVRRRAGRCRGRAALAVASDAGSDGSGSVSDA